MKTRKQPSTKARTFPKGFALVVSLTMLVLLTVIAVGLLSLSAITLRTASQTSAQAEAQANARMALMIAIGELQKQMGPDQRISANANILSLDESGGETPVANPHWTGTWDSWRAGPTSEEAGYPSDPSDHRTIPGSSNVRDGMHPSYAENRRDHFRSWLLSLNPSEAIDIESPRGINIDAVRMPDGNNNGIVLVGEGSLGASRADETVNARLLLVHDKNGTNIRGRYGWWVGDESQKANIMEDSYSNSQPADLAERLNRQQAPASLGNTRISGLENLVDQSTLALIPSRNSLALIESTTPQIMEQFHHVTHTSLGILADVREGGLKRDLSTILERKTDPTEVYNMTNVAAFQRPTSLQRGGEDFMLYNFDDLSNRSFGRTGQAAVPIQDLAVYYQLYDRYRSGSKGGVQYSSNESQPSNNLLRNGIMVSNPDYGRTANDDEKYLLQNTSLYRRPVPVKIEMILSYSAEPIEPAPVANRENPNPDTHRLRLGISPAVTFWNPNNVPLVMNIGDPDQDSLMMREIPIPLRFTFRKSQNSNEGPYQEVVRQMGQVTSTQQGELYTFFVSGNYPVVFEPGESKVVALRYASGTDADSAGIDVDFMLRGQGNNRFAERFVSELELVPGWNPNRFIRARTDGGARAQPIIMEFNKDDYISVIVEPGRNSGVGVEPHSFRNVFHQKSRHGRNAPGVKWNYHAFNIQGRFNNGNDRNFIDSVIYSGFPLGGTGAIVDTTPRIIELPQKRGQGIIDAIGDPSNPHDDLPVPFFYYGIKAATETHESNNVANSPAGAGRRFVTRPFTHSTAIAPAFIDQTDPASLYNQPWSWFLMPLDNLIEAPVEISGNNSGYYGGGYTAENGVTHIVQQQLPLTPPISIATLSHAHLGGFSLGTEPAHHGNEEGFRRTTALGHGGLSPHTLQAIGNSYAHPLIPANRAWTMRTRQYEGNNREDEPFADHSYLANKALWDEFYFSSISPRPSDVRVNSRAMSAEQVARKFFFENEPLPNPRIVPHTKNLTESQFDTLFATYNQFKGGFADQIAAHLMVEGPFNINSTSVQAWKALFSSLKDSRVSYLDSRSALEAGVNLDNSETDGVPLAGGPLPNGRGYSGSSPDPSDREQWTGFRMLTDSEIDELAEAMVKQVKMRGPFLSLSDFVNRRLDDRASATDFALKGALQAALDDPNVSINADFRRSPRVFTNSEKSFMNQNAAFSQAMEGPVAYGSAAYVDQADILRNFPAQLTPRGDTFVIRAYGDSLDNAGNVVARAWCEAIVQRFPEYTDTADDPEVRQAELTSESNRSFGRKFEVTSFRWLNPLEI